MEADTSLVRTDRAVHLHAVTSVYLYFSFIVQPRNAENDYSFRLNDSLENLLVNQVWMLHHVWGYTLEHFLHCLVEFFLARILCCEIGHETVHILFSHLIHNASIC